MNGLRHLPNCSDKPVRSAGNSPECAFYAGKLKSLKKEGIVVGKLTTGRYKISKCGYIQTACKYCYSSFVIIAIIRHQVKRPVYAYIATVPKIMHLNPNVLYKESLIHY